MTFIFWLGREEETDLHAHMVFYCLCHFCFLFFKLLSVLLLCSPSPFQQLQELGEWQLWIVVFLHEYSTECFILVLFFFYLTRRRGSPGRTGVRRIWFSFHVSIISYQRSFALLCLMKQHTGFWLKGKIWSWGTRSLPPAPGFHSVSSSYANVVYLTSTCYFLCVCIWACKMACTAGVTLDFANLSSKGNNIRDLDKVSVTLESGMRGTLR